MVAISLRWPSRGEPHRLVQRKRQAPPGRQQHGAAVAARLAHGALSGEPSEGGAWGTALSSFNAVGSPVAVSPTARLGGDPCGRQPSRDRTLSVHSIGKVVGGIVGAGVVLGAAVGALWLARHEPRLPAAGGSRGQERDDATAGGGDMSAASVACQERACREVWPVPAPYLAVGGGAFPENTEVSLEQDLTLLTQVLGPGGVVLFGGGPGAFSVRELRSTPLTRKQVLLGELGQLFWPRQGRDSRYRSSELRAGDATLTRVTERLEAEFEVAGAPLLLYIATHGEPGSDPASVAVSLWGGHQFTPHDLAMLHDGSSRPLRLVATSCYSGGFAELAFNDADPDAGAALADRCGVFAGTWDRETSGCDPDPERRHQEAYGLHLLHALRGERRDGTPLAHSPVDVDNNGRLNLLEAHTWARVAARSIDLPTTTAERFLREVQTERTPTDGALLPEERVLVTLLGERLGVRTLVEAQRELQLQQGRLRALDDGLSAAEDGLDEAYLALSTRLLSRFPVLSDAYHPEFETTLQQHGSAIRSLLHSSGEALAYEQARRAVAEFDAELARGQVFEAELQRLVRAWETLELAAGLAARGGPDLEEYQRLLACERAELALEGE